MSSQKQIIDLCNTAFSCVRELLSDEQQREVDDYINQHNEWGLGIEFLIDWLTEDETPITPSQFDAIHSAMSAMGLGDSRRIQGLKTYCLRGAET